jgi:hypothetical protein
MRSTPHDPRRPLQLAIRSMRILGFLFITLAGLAAAFVAIFGAMSVLLFLLCLQPGAAYLVLVPFLRQLRTWAVTVSLIVTALQGLVALAAGAALFMATIEGQLSDVPVILGLLWLVVLMWIMAMLQLIYHLFRSYAAVRIIRAESQRGFEPIMPIASLPVQTDTPSTGLTP